MRFTQLLHDHLLLCVERYKAGEYTKDEIRALTGRIARLKSVSSKLDAVKDMDQLHADKTTKNFQRARLLVRNASLIVAMDTGRDFDTGRLEDLGVSMWREGERSTTVYVIDRVAKKREQSGEIFLHGETHVVTKNELHNIAQHYYDAADLCVFHQADQDLKALQLDTSAHRYLDTALISERWFFSGHPSLKDLCERYSINCAMWHNSGNDAYYTLRVLLAMVDDSREGCRRIRRPQYRVA